MISIAQRHQCVRYRGVVMQESPKRVKGRSSHRHRRPIKSRRFPGRFFEPCPARLDSNRRNHLLFQRPSRMMATSISSMPAALTALINFEMSTATGVALQSFIVSPLHVVHVRRPCVEPLLKYGMPVTVPFLPMVVSRGREDQSSFWPEPRIVQMPVE
ncbi:hypothetical protein B0T13DRAFT_15203 [Neurospora crassa]|nr:hypothetical protein B0T13DRAFT_15203 [Neurospora crassa]